MGASNVSATYTCWARLDHVPFRLLVYMAMVSLDRDDPPLFWGGREDLARAIGRTLPTEPADDDHSSAAAQARRERRAAFEAVRAGLAVLKREGVITVAKAARFGTRAEYRLHLQAQAQPVSELQADPVPAAQADPARRAGSAWTKPQARPAPEEKSGLTGSLPGEQGLGPDPSLEQMAVPA